MADLLAWSAGARLAAAGAMLAVLWIAVYWAVALGAAAARGAS